MSKKVFLLSSIIIVSALSGCSLQKSNAGLEVRSEPGSTVYINDKETGSTPYKNEKMEPGEYTVKLKNSDAEWTSSKIRITPNTVYYINRELAKNPENQSGENISLERGKGITLVTVPSEVEVALDGQKQGNTPYLIPTVSTGEHEITLSKTGYTTKSLKVRAVDGYKIVIEAQLKNESAQSETPSASASASPSATASASPSGKATPTPKPTATVKPTATPKASASASAQPSASTAAGEGTVTILSTPTGWLRVRDKAGIEGQEVAKVNTGETFAYDERLDSGWTRITLTDGTKGYVASRYVKVNK